MDTQQFLAGFGHIANAPRGIERLRELIYQFAVTGRLVPQQADEGSAQATLENVTRIRQKLIAEKQWKRAPKLESVPLELPAIELPPSWRWSRLLDLGEINPRNPASDEAKATFVPMAAPCQKNTVKLWPEQRRTGRTLAGATRTSPTAMYCSQKLRRVSRTARPLLSAV